MTLFWTALFLCSLLLQYASFAAPGSALAATFNAGTLQGFEIDGDLKANNASTNPGGLSAGVVVGGLPMTNGDDWMAPTPPNTVIMDDKANDASDVWYKHGKELDTTDWSYQAKEVTPGKDDMKHVMAHVRFDASNNAYFFAGAERTVTTGATHLTYELNQKPWKLYNGVLKPDRSVGDVLIAIDFETGGTQPTVRIHKMESVTTSSTGQVVTVGSDLAVASAIRAAVNLVALPDQGFGYAMDAFTVTEVGINLSALGINTGCPGLAAGNVRTRSGSDLLSSDLKDWATPFPIDLNNCGKVTIVKDAVPNDAQDFGYSGTFGAFSLDDDADATLSNTKVFSDVVPGAYSVTEGAVEGWTLTNLVCDDANGSVNLGTRTASLNVGPNEEITCTFTNTKQAKLIVKKLTSPAGLSGSFSFSGAVSGSIGHDQTITSGFLDPGQYQVTEADPTPPFDLGSISCNDANSSGNVGTRTATYNLEAGEIVTCTFTNVRRGSITIIKDAVPNDDQDFSYTGTGGLGGFVLDDNGNNADGTSNTKTFSDVVPGNYDVTETAVAGWDLTDLQCNGTGGSSGTADGATAEISLTAGGSVTCTFTNTKRGQIIVEKQTLPDGSPQSFSFSGALSGSIGDGGTISDSVAPGQYAVSELVPAGWALTSITCDDANSSGSTNTATATFNVEPGETVTCTFTNTQDGEIIVEKQTLPGGASATFAFSGALSGTIGDDGTLSLGVAPGQYAVTETVTAGWALTDISCDDGNSSGNLGTATATFNVEPGETVTCTFTNTQDGLIIVEKQTLPDGSPQTFAFSGAIASSLGDGDTASLAVAPGTYAVSEAVPAGWALTDITCDDANSTGDTGAGTATFRVAAGETVTCTFTNTQDGQIVVEKQTLPDGSPAQFTFSGDLAGSIGDGGTISIGVAPGQYSSTEAAKAGWDLTDITCDDGNSSGSLGTRTATFNVEPGEVVTCTFTNVQRGTIVVEKQTSPDGASGSFTFSGDAAGSLGDGGQIIVSNLVPGTYTSTEADPGPGFHLGAIVCDDSQSANASSGDVATRTATFELDPGETVTCVFTNVQRGTITIIKDAQPDSGQDFHYDFTGLAGPVAFVLDDDADEALPNTVSFANLVAGSYSVTESAAEGWDLTDLDCEVNGSGTSAQVDGATADLTLGDGGSIVCVFVNSKPSISIVKTAGTAADGAVFVTGPGNVTYTYLVTNTGPVALNDVTVVDDNGTPANSGDDFSATCPKTTLAAGESMTCTATVAVSSSRTNVATASGESDGGTTVDDTDDAVVRIPVVDITKGHGDADGIVGRTQTVTYTINVSIAQGPVTNATVTDTLPAGQTYTTGTQQSTPAATSFTLSADGRTLTWTWASLSTAAVITYDVTIDAGAATGTQTNVAELCVSELENCEDDDATVKVPDLVIDKSFTGNTGGTGPGGIAEAKVGDILTYTLAYDLTNGPVHDGVITDVIPVGLEYVAGSATGNAEFSFHSYTAATRTLRWTAALVSADGSVTYRVRVLTGADELPQPLVNVATIDSAETLPDDDDDRVFVEPPPQIVTATPRITLPPTNTSDDTPRGSSNPGFTLMLVLLGLAGFALAVGYATPVPVRSRRRDRR